MASLAVLLQQYCAALRPRQNNNNLLVLVVLMAICITIPFDITQLLFTVIGAAAYLMLQYLNRLFDQKNKLGSKHKQSSTASKGAKLVQGKLAPRPAARQPQHQRRQGAACKAEVAVSPVLAPRFRGAGLEAEVQELLEQMRPTAASVEAVDCLARHVQQQLASTSPGLQVTGFASSDPCRGRANGVAVPDVELVVNVQPRADTKQVDLRLHQKAVLRQCADQLVSHGGFKFRRSAFKASEPKVTLLSPATVGFGQAIPVDISVNAVTPLHTAALITECGVLEPRARELILLVRRWVKDRGICHAPKGHLSVYAWTILTIYFLQRDQLEEGALLPALEDFESSSKLLPGQQPSPEQVRSRPKWKPKPGEPGAGADSAAKLLQSFMRFYASKFAWATDRISLCRQQAAATVPGISDPGGEAEQPPLCCIEDPFELGSNLGSGMNAWSFQRMMEEMHRAAALLSAESASLSKLLEPWSPPEGLDARVEEASRDKDV
eukprot:TRINITY_DN26849_c0_g1_i1.p1 TRINITY_DN26849_c0_g1~~TRINITY_DN26849_c0_g1_i1.p1  ORF type:complete len:494 (-),score=105.94 TRINITY_DN26849_c0_g1_i1:138-1619(-)